MATVIIRPKLSGGYGLIEVTPEFAYRLKKALDDKALCVAAGLEDVDPITQFVWMLLRDAF